MKKFPLAFDANCVLKSFFMENKEIYFITGKRSAFGKYLGMLSRMEPIELASRVARATLKELHQHNPEIEKIGIDHIFVGNCIQAIFDSPSTIGRQIALSLGLNKFTITLDTACCSPLTGLRLACWAMEADRIDSALLIGIEMMSATPHLLRNCRGGIRAGALVAHDPIYPIEYKGYNPVAVDASNGAKKYGISRKMLDIWALGSHQKWKRANEAGFFKKEIVPLLIKDRKTQHIFDTDEFPRPSSTLARIQMLPPVFGSEMITAGNAPGLNDGCSVAFIATKKFTEKHGIKPLARIKGYEEYAGEPEGISWAAGYAIKKCLEKTGWSIKEVDVVEINEAFAAMPLVSAKVLSGEDERLFSSILKKTNPNGGAIAIGHPVGASGLRILTTMVNELKRRKKKKGICAICGGLSQAEAVAVETL